MKIDIDMVTQCRYHYIDRRYSFDMLRHKCHHPKFKDNPDKPCNPYDGFPKDCPLMDVVE